VVPMLEASAVETGAERAAAAERAPEPVAEA
jgi:hypothetical protein